MTTKKKEVDEMTFKEFWEEEEKKETDKEAVNLDKRVFLEILRKKGFSTEQINNMKMDRAKQICWPVMFETLETQLKNAICSISKVLNQYNVKIDELAALWKIPEKRKSLLTNKTLRKSLLELATRMDDIERGLFKTDDLTRQLLEEFKKQRDSEKKG